ncbi:hypothetical protein CS022_18265 [Veronia nyctiphanis]|uniref:Class IIb bacteriocin, lactobin A/cerein 7B family n=1 Tax=Veronia nyctiphanis TaxID=1278244 RepID=A0A4Q0YPV8_9GAMM|nr:class IIb bacteriocin, lactobin A/cerein 7B family [Veronia nyctiphanis]RXJ72024.1 hypothetical protein CS022_17985 [Veronia nyctiphanis]RXJ72071.1 hypothetical protein CS022_18265 [Veronia nyctiphanis]
MKELNTAEVKEVAGGALPVAVIAVTEAIAFVGGVAGIAAWLLDD